MRIQSCSRVIVDVGICLYVVYNMLTRAQTSANSPQLLSGVVMIRLGCDLRDSQDELTIETSYFDVVIIHHYATASGASRTLDDLSANKPKNIQLHAQNSKFWHFSVQRVNI